MLSALRFDNDHFIYLLSCIFGKYSILILLDGVMFMNDDINRCISCLWWQTGILVSNYILFILRDTAKPDLTMTFSTKNVYIHALTQYWSVSKYTQPVSHANKSSHSAICECVNECDVPPNLKLLSHQCSSAALLHIAPVHTAYCATPLLSTNCNSTSRNVGALRVGASDKYKLCFWVCLLFVQYCVLSCCIGTWKPVYN